MGQDIGRTAQPTQGFIIEGVDVVVGSVIQKIPFHIADHIFYFTFSFRIGFSAKTD